MFTYQYGYSFNLGLNVRCVKFQAENVARTNQDGPFTEQFVSVLSAGGKVADELVEVCMDAHVDTLDIS